MNTLSFYSRILNDVPMVSDGQFTAWMAGLENHQTSAEAFTRMLLASPVSAEPYYFARMRKSMEPKMTVSSEGIATIPINGALAYAPDPFEMLFMGMEDSRSVLAMVRQAAEDSGVKKAFLNINSPGGMVMGGTDIADAVAEMVKKGKPCMAYTGGVMASLAYQIGSQASAIVASRSAMIGSIGTMSSFMDRSRMFEAAGVKVHLFRSAGADLKGIGTPGVPLSEEQVKYLQSRVDAAAEDFRSMVLSKRPNVTADSMRGQGFTGGDALKRGLIDAVGSEDSAMAFLRRMTG